MVSPTRHVLRYVREVRPLHFPASEPEDEKVPETKEHYEQRSLLYQVLRHNFADRCSIGCDQFVYFNARNPRVNLAPDVFLKLDRPDELFKTWKTWERGVPELVIEVVSPTENFGADWDAKLEGYHELGVRELVRFDPQEERGRRLHIWDRIEDDLVERVIEGDASPCTILGLSWIVREEDLVHLRLAGADGRLLMTALEDSRATLAREREEAAREREATARRIAELEAALKKR
jgi:Uma2 family endonuclease